MLLLLVRRAFLNKSPDLTNQYHIKHPTILLLLLLVKTSTLSSVLLGPSYLPQAAPMINHFFVYVFVYSHPLSYLPHLLKSPSLPLYTYPPSSNPNSNQINQTKTKEKNSLI